MDNRQIEIPVNNNENVFSRTLNTNSPTNSHIQLSESEKELKELKKKLTELKIRFDTSPSYYQRDDYQALINAITSSLIHLYEDASHAQVITSWEQVVSDKTVPSAKLVKDTLDLVEATLESQYADLKQAITETKAQVVTSETNIKNKIDNIDLTTVAKELTLNTNTLTILTKIETTQPDLSTVAKEALATSNKNEVLQAIASIPAPDLSLVAKEAQATVNKQEILQAIDDIPEPVIPIDYAKEAAATSNKQEILTAIDNIPAPDLSSVAKEVTLQGVSGKIGTFTDPTETVAHKLENLTFDKTDLAKEATTAKQGSNPNATNTAILAAIPSEEVMKQLYAGRAEQNNDGDNTYTIVIPYTAQVIETPDGNQIIL